MLATLATAGQRSATSLAIGPLKIVPFGFPFMSLRTTPALSSNATLIPLERRYSFFCRTMITGTTVLRISNFPFFTEANTKSPTPAAGMRPRTVLCPITEMTLSIFAPELSHAVIRACEGRDRVILLLTPFIDHHPVLFHLKD